MQSSSRDFFQRLQKMTQQKKPQRFFNRCGFFISIQLVVLK